MDRYVVRGRIGKGSFGQVVRAFDKVTKADVALKMIKSKKPFKLQSHTEVDILVQLVSSPKSEQSHIIRLLNHFEHRGHPCLVFEFLSYNLYELLKNTKFRGVSLDLCHKFCKQCLEALRYLGDQSIIHCDLKVGHVTAAPCNKIACDPSKSKKKKTARHHRAPTATTLTPVKQ